MDVSAVSPNQPFSGCVIIKNSINPKQYHLFNLHKDAIERKMKDLPFDLFVEQSKSKKSIALYTNVQGANSYFVRRNQHNFIEVADFAITDAMTKSEIYQKMLKINEIFEHQKLFMLNVLSGNVKKAREVSKELAKISVENFEAYKEIPHLKLAGLPPQAIPVIIKNSLKYRIYRAFTSSTPEEKEFLKLKKEFFNELKTRNKKIKTVTINLPNFYY